MSENSGNTSTSSRIRNRALLAEPAIALASLRYDGNEPNTQINWLPLPGELTAFQAFAGELVLQRQFSLSHDTLTVVTTISNSGGGRNTTRPTSREQKTS